MSKIQDDLAALKQRVMAAPEQDRARMQLDGLNGALAQAIADAKSAGLSGAQLMGFEAVQQAMDSDLRGEAQQPQQEQPPQQPPAQG